MAFLEIRQKTTFLGLFRYISMMAWHGSAQMFLSTPTLRIYSLLFKSYTMVIKFTLSLTNLHL